MTTLRKITRPILVATVIAATAAVGDARAGDCDDDCPFDGWGWFHLCYEHDLGGIECGYSDNHYYMSFGGSC